jgi:hypothetical protein
MARAACRQCISGNVALRLDDPWGRRIILLFVPNKNYRNEHIFLSANIVAFKRGDAP